MGKERLLALPPRYVTLFIEVEAEEEVERKKRMAE